MESPPLRAEENDIEEVGGCGCGSGRGGGSGIGFGAADDSDVKDAAAGELGEKAVEGPASRLRLPPLNMALTSSQACNTRSSFSSCISSRWRRHELKLAASGWR